MRELTFHTAFLRGSSLDAGKVAVIDGDYQATHGEHRRRAMQLSAVLRGLGLGPEDRFAVLAGNDHRYLELWHAAGLGAAVINPLNTRLSPNELSYILEDSGTEVLFCSPAFESVVDELVADGTKLREVVSFDRYEALLSEVEPWLPPEPDEDATCILMYTGGTTGLPKGVVLTQRNVALCLYHMTMSMKLDSSFRYLIFLAMFHVAGSLGIFGPWAGGGTAVLLPGFEPGAVIDAIEQHQITDAGFVPTMMAMMLQHPEFRPERLASLRNAGYGAAPMPQGLLLRLLELFPEMGTYQGYGMTEATGVITYLSPDAHRRGGERLRSVGQPMHGVTFSIRGPDDEELGVREIGEVCVRSGTIMKEYWHQPEATAAALGNGWYHTGDMGFLDEDGYLFLVDRVKDMIVSGGENVYSTEVENALSTHPAVAAVAVIGVPHELWGEAVHAIVICKPDVIVTVDELKEHARQTLAGYKVPKTIALRAEPFPLSAAGKVLKRELRRPYWEAEGAS